jgi:hypothetical protein
MLAEILARLVACLSLSHGYAVSVNEDSSFESLIRSANAVVRSEKSSQASFDSGGFSLESMASTFARSEKAHLESMASISRSLSLFKAIDVMRKTHAVSREVSEIADMALRKLKHGKQPQGYAGVDGARKLLNDMIFQSTNKYDTEIAKCTEYYAAQCAQMESCRGQIGGANYIAANARALSLDAQSNIHRCEEDIPTKKYELKQHLLKCEDQLHSLRTRLEIVSGDIAVMTMILEMTDCDKSLLQTNTLALLHCQDPCTKKSFISFNQSRLQNKVNELKSAFAQELMTDTFKDLFAGVKAMQSYALLETGSEQEPININRTRFYNPPLPITRVPSDPCKNPDQAAPSTVLKRSAKCSFTKSPQCYKLQERFLLIQAGIMDERDELLEEIAMLDNYCEETKGLIEKQIKNAESLLGREEEKLAAATEKEATALEIARTTAQEFDKLDKDLLKQMKTCSTNYVNFETEICALKKIRGELYKLKGTGNDAIFQDCELSQWDPEEISTSYLICGRVVGHPENSRACVWNNEF